MKNLLKIIILFPAILLISCSTRTEIIESDLKPFIEKHFPESNYSVQNINNNIHLTINTKQNLFDEYVEGKMTMTLGTLYRSFYYSSSIVPIDTAISITLKSDNSKWDSKKYDLHQLGEIFELKTRYNTKI